MFLNKEIWEKNCSLCRQAGFIELSVVPALIGVVLFEPPYLPWLSRPGKFQRGVDVSGTDPELAGLPFLLVGSVQVYYDVSLNFERMRFAHRLLW